MLFPPTQAPLAEPLSEQEKLDWLRLIRTDNVGPITFYKLLEQFGSAGAAGLRPAGRCRRCGASSGE